jgi:hypothetical protein
VISLIDLPAAASALMPLLSSCRRRNPSYWIRSAQVSSAGSITVDPRVWKHQQAARRQALRDPAKEADRP